jgi:hypothetical protein
MGPNALNEIKTLRELAERISTIASMPKPEATPELILEIIKSWLEGHRGPMLPGGSVGIATAVILDNIEIYLPGALASLVDG